MGVGTGMIGLGTGMAWDRGDMSRGVGMGIAWVCQQGWHRDGDRDRDGRRGDRDGTAMGLGW